MAVYWVLAFMLSVSLVINHGDKFIRLARKLISKIIKPKFKEGQHVMIDNVEWKIIMITQPYYPYVYYCYPISIKNVRMPLDSYVPEKRIKAKTGIFKELD